MTFTATKDATAIATWSAGSETPRAEWNGKYYSLPVGVGSTETRSYRTLITIPIDYDAIIADGGVEITRATLNLRYFNRDAYNKTDSSGSRTIYVRGLYTDFTETPGSTSATTGWKSSTTQNWNLNCSDTGGDYDAYVLTNRQSQYFNLTGTKADKTLISADITALCVRTAPSSLLTTLFETAPGLGMSYKGLLLIDTSVNGHNKAAEFYSIEGAEAYSTDAPQIVVEYTVNAKPSKPVIVSPKYGDLQSGTDVTFSAEFVDTDVADTITKFDLEISINSDWSTPFYSSQYSTTATPFTAVVPMSNFDSNIDYYYRIRTYDQWGTVGLWSTDANAYFTAPTNTGGQVDPEGNPNFSTTKTIGRNKYRLEFYPLLASLNGFDPNPCAVIFDAKKIGIAQAVNGPGEFFFTLPSKHAQIAFIEPQRTFWRACRWDQDDGFFRVMGEGLVVKSVSQPNEVVFYGIDKLGMVDRQLSATDNILSEYSHIDITIGELHDSITKRNISTSAITGARSYAKATITDVTINSSKSITGITFPTGGTVRFATATNTFRVGERVTITGVVPTSYNLSDQIITGVSSSYVEIASSLTTAWSSGGTITSGTIRYTANNTFQQNDIVDIAGITPSALNISNATIRSATSTNFDVWSTSTGTYSSGGEATPDKYGYVTYTSANTYVAGQVVTISSVVGDASWNQELVTISSRTATAFDVKSASSGTYTSGGIATPAKTILDMGWGESPTTRFRDYSEENAGNDTQSTTKSVKAIGLGCMTALAAMADLVMAGSSDKVIIENPNIGQAAAKIDTMSVGLRHRHLTLEQQEKSNWWLMYRSNLKRFVVNDNLDMMATRANVINETTIGSNSSLSAYNGNTDATLYAQYGLIDKIERVADVGSKIDYAAQLQYNLQPDRLFSIELDIVPNSIVPFKGYGVGDSLSVFIKDDQVDISKDLDVVAQQWIGNANGAEFLALGFAQKITQKFMTASQTAPLVTEPIRVTSATIGTTTTIPTASGTGTSSFSWSKR
jgi:hypothetical protein